MIAPYSVHVSFEQQSRAEFHASLESRTLITLIYIITLYLLLKTLYVALDLAMSARLAVDSFFLSTSDLLNALRK